MFRFSLIVCVSLVIAVTAKPHKPWNKLTDEVFQDTVVSIDDNGKMSWGVEVEPPEDTDETLYDVDARMMIWKSMTGSGQDKQHLRPEEDLDELDHPSVAELLKVQIQNLDVLPAAEIQAEPLQEDANVKYNQEPEEDKKEPEQDWDEVYHKAKEELDGYLAPLVAGYKDGPPEKDEPYHRDDPLRREIRVHLQPEEDMDDLYHKDLLLPIPYQDEARAAAPVDLPTQRRHSEPEEDLDDFYHQ